MDIRPINDDIDPLELVVYWNKLRPVTGPMRRVLQVLREVARAHGKNA